MFVRYSAQCFDTFQLDKWTEKPAFGTPLEEHLKRSGREIAVPIEACVMMLLETGMREEVGKHRIAGWERRRKELGHARGRVSVLFNKLLK